MLLQFANLAKLRLNRRVANAVSLLFLVGMVAACADPASKAEIFDPYEKQNRAQHAENKFLDRNILSPLAQTYGEVVPPVGDSFVRNFADHVALPGRAANNLLQFDIGGFFETTIRFAINTVVGIGGLFDPASSGGVPDRDTDFGETLYVWGIPEGAFVELPLFGASTEREAVGIAVDLFLDPLNSVLPKWARSGSTAIKLTGKVSERNEYSDIVNDVLYTSADSYATQRQLYLQNRRHHLNKGLSEEDLEDPYAE